MLESVPQFLAGGLAIGAVYGLIGAGFSLIFNTSKVVNFAQGQFVVYGGLIAYTLASLRWPAWAALPTAVVIVAAMGAAMQWLLSRARKGSHELSLIMVTIGVAIALQGLAHELWGADYVTFPLFPDGGVRVLGAVVNHATTTTLAVTVVVCIGLWLFLFRSLEGKAMRACATAPRVARTIGIRPARLTLVAYLVSAALGGLAGILLTPSLMMSSEFGVLLGIKGFTAAIVGGLVNPFGAVVGGVLLGLFEGLCVGLISSDLQDAYAFVALLAVLMMRPQGLFGKPLAGTAR